VTTTTILSCPWCPHPLLSRRPDRSGPDHGSEGCWGTVTVCGEGGAYRSERCGCAYVAGEREAVG
jgi:hypothetical protein